MTVQMKLFLKSLVTSNRAQIRALERQIKDINGLLYVANEAVVARCCPVNRIGEHLPGCVSYEN